MPPTTFVYSAAAAFSAAEPRWKESRERTPSSDSGFSRSRVYRWDRRVSTWKSGSAGGKCGERLSTRFRPPPRQPAMICWSRAREGASAYWISSMVTNRGVSLTASLRTEARRSPSSIRGSSCVSSEAAAVSRVMASRRRAGSGEITPSMPAWCRSLRTTPKDTEAFIGELDTLRCGMDARAASRETKWTSSVFPDPVPPSITTNEGLPLSAPENAFVRTEISWSRSKRSMRFASGTGGCSPERVRAGGVGVKFGSEGSLSPSGARGSLCGCVSSSFNVRRTCPQRPRRTGQGRGEAMAVRASGRHDGDMWVCSARGGTRARSCGRGGGDAGR